MADKTKVEFVPREVIENKLLVRLCEKGQVAILASRTDLLMFLAALQVYHGIVAEPEIKREVVDMMDGLRKLLDHV